MAAVGAQKGPTCTSNLSSAAAVLRPSLVTRDEHASANLVIRANLTNKQKSAC